jgi:hypothetical protein
MEIFHLFLPWFFDYFLQFKTQEPKLKMLQALPLPNGTLR